MSTFDGTLPFFDNNGAARDLVALNYTGCEFEKAINVNDIEYEPMFQAMLVKNYTNKTCKGTTMEDTGIHCEITDLITDTARFHAEVDPHGGKHVATTVGDELRTQVFGNFGSYSDDERKFYITFLNVVKDNKQIDFHAAITATDPTHIRINLKKTRDNTEYKDRVLFGETLPPVPNSVNTIYMSNGLHLKQDSYKGIWERALKDLYWNTYTSASPVPSAPSAPSSSGFPTPGYGVPASGYGVPASGMFQGGARKFPNDHLNFDIKELVKNCIVIHANKSSRKASAKSGTNLDNFDDLYVNMVNGYKYIKDENNVLYRMESNGTKVKVDDVSVDEIKCGVGIDDNDKCQTVFNCLLSGNKQNLTTCLNFYKTADMFAIAKREVEKMNPKVALLLLNTFGFTPKKDIRTGLRLPPTFEDWAANILPNSPQISEATVNKIKSNHQLMSYLRSVVNIIRSNPAILNDNPKPTKYNRPGADMQVFYQPDPSQLKDCDMKNMSDHILQQSILQARQVIPNLSMPLGGYLTNVSSLVIKPQVLNGSFKMIGGGVSKYDSQCVNACALENTFKFTLGEMERNGKMLVEEDKDRIDAAIAKVAKREKQLLQLLDDIRLFTTLDKVNPQSSQVSDVKLRDIVNIAGNARESGGNITQMALNNLNQSATLNINEMTKLINDLIFKVQQSLVDVNGGRVSSYLSPL
jgi:hypothetical protein